jgi:IS5 family transposase
MKPLKPKKESVDLFRSRLEQILNPKHPLFRLAGQIDWTYFETELGNTYEERMGAPGKPIRLMVGLHYLKHTFDESDESIVDRFVENPYWQYFCGLEYFTHEFPIDPSSMTRFRQRIKTAGMENLLREIISTARRSKALTSHHMRKVNVDTTVQEKAIRFPTDGHLYHRMRERLVAEAARLDIPLRQSYKRLSKKALLKQHRYAHAKQMKRARKMTRQLKTYLGCVHRDIQRKVGEADERLQQELDLARRLLMQERDNKNKLYSLHAPEVECISKGKAHKRYEFGCKVGFVSSSSGNWVLGIQAFHGNPYDGHTLGSSLEQMERVTGEKAREVYVDKGYRGHGYAGESRVHIVDFRGHKKQSRSVRKWYKRRAAIEPVIGHAKSDNRLNKNYYAGQEGDQINALLAACGYNMRKLLAVFLYLIGKTEQQTENRTNFLHGEQSVRRSICFAHL